MLTNKAIALRVIQCRGFFRERALPLQNILPEVQRGRFPFLLTNEQNERNVKHPHN